MPDASPDPVEAKIYADERTFAGPGRPEERPPPGALICPVCGTTAVRFLPFGRDGRRNARCPSCGSVERHRFLWLWMLRETRLLHTKQRVLHTAPERSLAPKFRDLAHWRYRTSDRFDPMADIKADLTDLPLATAGLDGVISSHVLEHIPDDAKALSELARVIRPGGWAILMFPYDPKRAETLEGRDVSDPAERARRFGHPYHFRIPGRDYMERIRAAGLEPVEVASKRWLPGHQRRRFRINRNFLFFCTRTRD